MDANQFQQLLQALQAGLQPLANVQQPQQQVPAAFALTPGQVNPNQPLDLSTSTGIKVWQESTAPLSFKFSAEGGEVNQFCEKLMERAEKAGWNMPGGDVLTIPDGNGNNYNIIQEYG
jgi:hypothetical protein